MELVYCSDTFWKLSIVKEIKNQLPQNLCSLCSGNSMVQGIEKE